MSKVSLTVWISESELQALKFECDRQQRNKTEIVRELLRSLPAFEADKRSPAQV